MSTQQNFNNVKIYNIDLTVTDDCNFNCSYCFEHGFFNKNYFKDVELFKSKMNELLDSFFFKTNYQILNIGFWGGEPTLNKDVIEKIVDYYAKDDRVKFFIYSNGSNTKEYLDLLKSFKDERLNGGHPKFCIQISYDGMPIQDICRKEKNGKLTSTMIRENIRLLSKENIPFVIKSTISPEAFKYLPEARKDILSIIKEFPLKENTFKSLNYFPTIDYYNIEKYTDEEIEQYYKDLHKSLIEISSDEIEYFKENNRFFFAWFNPSKALCSAGRDMVCINWDNNIFKCHGSVYEDSVGDHYITSLNDNDFISKLIDSHKQHNYCFGEEPDECKTCFATYCLRCNAVKYNHSKENTYLKKWRDYTNQPRLCKFYKLNGKIVLAIKEIIGG